ncbi:AAA family ATPase [Mycobacterium sp. 1245801.1]|uniref:AAA family ATPase n=1 Tax=Mycobacterium sp. 1245801.1 TaxID=1834075 RepID=UPI000801D39E|nr:AAA family ATPase [Mycobacterium sp. 1245801.1]OBJ19887.1 hypothetical protein A5622_20205 [Mycobacterium sp. 1245801.1]
MTDAANVIPFTQRLQDAGLTPPKPTPRPATYTPIVTTPSDGTRERKYAEGALQKECTGIAAMAPNSGRNHALNAAKFSLARFINAGIITNAEVDAALTAAALASGLPQDEIDDCLKGDRHQRAAAEKLGHQPAVPPPTESDLGNTTFDPGVLDETDEHGQPTEAAQQAQDYFNNAIRQRALQLRIDDAAREFYNDWQASQLGQSMPDIINLRDFLAVPDEDAQYRITDLWPTGGNVLLAAQYKAGKTSMIANLLRALADGTPFLGKFATAPPKRITLFDDELDERMLRRWLREQGIINEAFIDIASMKGRLATFNILNARTRAQWAERIRGSELVILDCLRPCLDAIGLDEHRDAGRFLVAWDSLKKEAGVSESIVVHHMGHGQERSRGDSRLLDWPDVNWKIVKEAQAEDADQEDTADGGRRFFSAHGRDVSVPEGQLVWEPEGRTLTYRDGGRKAAKVNDAIDHIRAVMRQLTGSRSLNKGDLVARLQSDHGVGKHSAGKAVDQAIKDGVLFVSVGDNNAKMLSLSPSEAM